MAVDTYVKLQAAIANKANDDSLFADVTAFSPSTIDGAIKEAIDFSTKSLERELTARGGIKHMETVDNTIVTVAGTEYVDFPTDFAGVRAFMLTTNPITILEFTDPTTLFTQYPDSATAKPEKYTIIGRRRAYLRPIPDAAYTTRLIYYASIPALSTSNPTNWLLTYAPDVYLGQCMVEVCLHIENDERLQFWKGYTDERLNALMGDDRNVRWAAVPSKPNLQVSIA